jgi:hypothetical protein
VLCKACVDDLEDCVDRESRSKSEFQLQVGKSKDLPTISSSLPSSARVVHLVRTRVLFRKHSEKWWFRRRSKLLIVAQSHNVSPRRTLLRGGTPVKHIISTQASPAFVAIHTPKPRFVIALAYQLWQGQSLSEDWRSKARIVFSHRILIVRRVRDLKLTFSAFYKGDDRLTVCFELLFVLLVTGTS